MAEASIPVDLFNPGQVFACLGFMEAADILLGDAEGGFNWSNETDVRFRLAALGERNPVEAVLEFLAKTGVIALTPPGSGLSTKEWRIETNPTDGSFPFKEPPSPATLPAILQSADKKIGVDYWGDSTDLRDNVKFWAGAGGYPGAALLRDSLDLVRDEMLKAATNPFELAAPQSSSFRFDWRRDYIPIDAGFSPNEHRDITMVGYPLTEVLAAIGVTHARPLRIDKLHYRYAVVGGDGHLLPPEFLRAALGMAPLPFPMRRFSMKLGWPGKENQARCITEVREERQ
ncbi:MAG: type I-U CRISPR-associated protein Cas8c [Parvularculaceae bacterium]|nr:type I-U CRISPR-associated protein Cas8c [Parvularculaceae bacterium]